MRKRYLVALLIAVSLLGIVKYIELRSKNQLLLENLDLMKHKIFVSEDEKERLLQEISQLNFKLSEAEKIIRQLRISAALLKEEKVQLDQETSILRYEKEYLKDYLELKSYSLEELKKAIRQVKKEMRLAKRQMQKKIDLVAVTQGNQGYLVRDGESTFKKKRVRVLPDIK